ncbi:hypothetical protein L1887_59535 [Cichorium endivia]|nr:hypothetical protein L1887_59535 [Cichorium endivia]
MKVLGQFEAFHSRQIRPKRAFAFWKRKIVERRRPDSDSRGWVFGDCSCRSALRIARSPLPPSLPPKLRRDDSLPALAILDKVVTVEQRAMVGDGEDWRMLLKRVAGWIGQGTDGASISAGCQKWDAEAASRVGLDGVMLWPKENDGRDIGRRRYRAVGMVSTCAWLPNACKRWSRMVVQDVSQAKQETAWVGVGLQNASLVQNKALSRIVMAVVAQVRSAGRRCSTCWPAVTSRSSRGLMMVVATQVEDAGWWPSKQGVGESQRHSLSRPRRKTRRDRSEAARGWSGWCACQIADTPVPLPLPLPSPHPFSHLVCYVSIGWLCLGAGDERRRCVLSEKPSAGGKGREMAPRGMQTRGSFQGAGEKC